MAKATEFSSSCNALTPAPAGEVVSSLCRRLRQYARGINNAHAKRTIGADLIRAAAVIDSLMQGRTDDAQQAAAAVAWLGRQGYASLVNGRA